jgi:acetyl esterase/lipase
MALAIHMPSLRAQFFSSFTSLLLRRRKWGRNELELAKRARRKFGAPWFLQKLAVLGLDIKPVTEPYLRGEWIIPKSPGPGATILYIHGGGFVTCSAKTHRPITAALARKTGLKVFALDYRLAPENRFPAALDDVFEGYKRIREIEGGDVILAGDSAGGGLVLSLLLRIREAGLKPLACAVCFSPWADLTPREPACLNADEDAMFFPGNMAEFAAVYLADGSDVDPLASPIFADFSDLPPVLFQVSSTEILIEDSRLIHEKILEAGGVSELQIFNGLCHCWQMLNWFVPEAGLALDHAADFIRGHVEERKM